MRASLPSTLLSLIILLLPSTFADPASIPFQDCFDETQGVDQKFNVSTVYAQVLHNEEWGRYLNLTVLGTSPKDIVGMDNTSSSLSTLFTTSSVLTLDAWSNSSYLCQNMRPPSPLPALNSSDSTYCPITAGPFTFSSTVPWGRNRELTTLITQLRAVDPFGKELVCLDMFTTPLSPRPHSPYGKARIIFWSTVALAIGYWVVVGIARIASAWNRGITRPGHGIWSRAQSAGYILASAISGERLATGPALMRFVSTPSMRDVIFHTQWCAVLAMVAVEWPQFVYPLLTQTAWSTLSFNISLTESSQSHHWDAFNSTPYSPPTNFADQFADPTSPVFIDTTVPNILFSLPSDATDGISTFAYTIGIRATIVISVIIWSIDYTVNVIRDSVGGGQGHGTTMNRLGGRTRSPAFGTRAGAVPSSGTKFAHTRFTLPLAGSSSDRGINSHRSCVLHGNLVRILVLFHLPVTVFSCYQMTLPRSLVGTSSVVLGALSFLIFPSAYLHILSFLYDETKTLLSLGPLYNHYRHGSQLFASLFFATNIAFGVTIGAGQKSGTAQAIIILVVEVVSALVTSIWLPWGSGASMGLISFLFCVARIVIAVLLVILTQAISIGPGPGGWVAYGILIILALVYLALVLMLVVKVMEGLIRAFGGVGFDRSQHVIDSGILGACGLLGCCGSRKRRHGRRRSRNRRTAAGSPSQMDGESDMSSYLPPAGGVMPGSTHSQPPSVLRPEHANQPYKEELDTEDEGYIMGAWQPFPRPSAGYSPVSDGPQTSGLGKFVQQKQSQKPSTGSSASTATPSGFSRVGGGRAHIDTPYAIASGSTHTFPSLGQQSQATANHSSSALASSQPLSYEQGVEPDSHDASLSFSNVEVGLASSAAAAVAVGSNGLPPGAMPAHIRTKSQTAIVEDYLPAGPSSSSTAKQFQQQQQQQQGQGQPSSARQTHDEDSGDEPDTQKKKKPWYHLRRNRPHSIEGRTASTAELGAGAGAAPKVEEELGGLGNTAQPQRSFVVIRKPPGSMGRLNQPTASGSGGDAVAGGGTYPKASSRPPTR
ncbi:hypothetical protein BDZ97DRAFT_1940150 [Flammula alnicola]|nr:hypothetical protein BDZ97DRAFT_1940150 [Flammula alnicola]